jgi:competence protein ComEA
MRTRPDTQREAVTRRLALLRADLPIEEAEEEAAWWTAHTAVPLEPVEAADDGQPSMALPAPVALPVPGRHASRRRLALKVSWPESLAGRVRLGPAQLAVVALVVAAALALACWWLARGRATTLAPAVPPAAAASPLIALAAPVADVPATTLPSTAASSGASTSASAMVTVDVEGKVRHPGIVVLPAGSRVTDALDAAGGLPRRRSLGGLNLAAVLVDGQQITVGTKVGGSMTGPSGTAGDTGAAGSGAVDGAQVNLNTATADQLDTLPGVGPVTAQSILAWREENGGFTSVQELLEVSGIGAATLAKIAPHATV